MAGRLRRAAVVGSLRVRGTKRPDRDDGAVVVVPRMLFEERTAGLFRGATQAMRGGSSATAGCIEESKRAHIAADVFMPPSNQELEAQATLRGPQRKLRYEREVCYLFLWRF